MIHRGHLDVAFYSWYSSQSLVVWTAGQIYQCAVRNFRHDTCMIPDIAGLCFYP